MKNGRQINVIVVKFITTGVKVIEKSYYDAKQDYIWQSCKVEEIICTNVEEVVKAIGTHMRFTFYNHEIDEPFFNDLIDLEAMVDINFDKLSKQLEIINNRLNGPYKYTVELLPKSVE